MSAKGIGVTLGCGRRTSPLHVPAGVANELLVERAAAAVGLGKRGCSQKAPRSNNILTVEQAGYALWMQDHGWSMKQIGSALGLTYPQVYRVCQGFAHCSAQPIKPPDEILSKERK